MVRTNADYSEISVEFQKLELSLPHGVNTLDYLYYKANGHMFTYYLNKEKQYRRLLSSGKSKGSDRELLDAIGRKCLNLYARLYHSPVMLHKIRKCYEDIYLFEDRSTLFDLFVIFEEIFLYDLMALNVVKGKPHQKITFCFKNWARWKALKIVSDLSEKVLSQLLLQFVNAYSQKSGIPSLYVLLHFKPLENQLYESGTASTSLISYLSGNNPEECAQGLKGKQREFEGRVENKRANLIDKWCERIRKRLIDFVHE
ncbi:MAG: hypothetical protein N2645_11185 [Clostridia bacterium]|nr:hypothetical protein [Clostridia bacterium]